MSFPKYEAYKDSGVEWLGEVPEHWVSTRAKFVSTVFVPQRNKPELNTDEGLPWLTMEDMTSSRVSKTTYKVDEAAGFNAGSKVLKKGSVIASCVGNFGSASINEIDVIINQQLQAYIPTKIYPEYLRQIVSISGEYFNMVATAATVSYVNQEGFANIPLPLPTITEQIQIARFLDHETARIDALIAEQQRLIELLKEKQQTVISHAVTKGLDPTAPMKDSGVEWLGKIPTHWEIKALNKAIVKITNGYVGPTRDILVPSGVPYIQATHIKRGVVNFDDAYFVRSEWSLKMKKSILERDDVLIVQTGAGTGDVGLVSEKEEGYNCHALIIIQTIKSLIAGTYLAQVLQSTYGQSVLFSIRTGGMHPHLNCSEVRYIKVPIPPILEQIQIIQFIEHETTRIDSLIEQAKSGVELLQERRSVLISAAVTGKIDVRGWQAPASAIPAPTLEPVYG